MRVSSQSTVHRNAQILFKTEVEHSLTLSYDTELETGTNTYAGPTQNQREAWACHPAISLYRASCTTTTKDFHSQYPQMQDTYILIAKT